MAKVYVKAWADEAAFIADTTKPEGLIWGTTAFTTLSAALDAASGDASIDEIVVCSDIDNDSFSSINNIKITTTVEGGVTIKNTYDNWVYVSGNANIGAGVTIEDGYYFYYGEGNEFSGKILGNQNYHRYDNVITINPGGLLGCYESEFVIRFNKENNGTGGFRVIGDAAEGAAIEDRQVQLRADEYFAFYSGTIDATDTLITGGAIWMDNTFDGEGYKAIAKLHNTIWTSTSNLKMLGNASFTMTGGSILSVKNRIDPSEASIIGTDAVLSITDSTFIAADVQNSGTITVSGDSTIDIVNLDSEKQALVFDSADLTASSIKGKKAYINIKGDNTYDGTIDAYWIKVGYTDGETVNTGSLSFNKDASVKSAVLQIGEGSSLTYGSEKETFANAFNIPELYAGEGSALTIQNVDATSNIPVLFAQGNVVIDNADIKGNDLVLGNSQGNASLKIKDSTVTLGGASNAVVILGDAVGGELTLENSNVTVNQIGPGSSWDDTIQDVLTIGYKDGAVTVNINENSTLDIKYGAAINANSKVNVNGGTFIVANTVTNNGTIKVTGENASTIKGMVSGNAVQLAGGNLTATELNGEVKVVGADNKFTGTNTVGNIKVGFGSGTDYFEKDYSDQTNKLSVSGTLNAGIVYIGSDDTTNGVENSVEIADATVNLGNFNVRKTGKLDIDRAVINSTGASTNNKGKITVTDSTFNEKNSVLQKEGSLSFVRTTGSIGIGSNNATEVSGGELSFTDSTFDIQNLSVSAGASVKLVGSTITIKDVYANDLSGSNKTDINLNGELIIDAKSTITAVEFAGSGTITIDVAGFSGVKKIVDVNSSTFDKNNIKLIDSSLEEGGELATSYITNNEGDIILVNVDTSNLVVNSAWTSQDAIDAALGEDSGVVFKVNAFADINAAFRSAVANGGATITSINGSDFKIGESSYTYNGTVGEGIVRVGLEASGKEFIITGETSGDNSVALEMRGAEKESLTVVDGKVATVKIQNAEMAFYKLSAYNNSKIEIVDSVIDMRVYHANGGLFISGPLQTEDSGQLLIKNSTILNNIQISAWGQLFQVDNSTLNAGTASSVQGKMEVINNSTYSVINVGISNGGSLVIDNSKMIRKEAIFDIENQNDQVADSTEYVVYVGWSENVGCGDFVEENTAGSLTVQNGATFDFSKALYEGKAGANTDDSKVIVSKDSTITVDGSKAAVTFSADQVINNGTFTVSGESTINGGVDGDVVNAAQFSGSGWVYVKNATLDANTNIQGANIRFVEGESVIDGATINPTGNYFQVGAGHFITDHDNPNKEAELDRENDVTVIVKNNAYIDGGSAEGYGTWVGTEYYENNNDAKVANMTEARYTLDIQNSLAVFDTIHVSNDGILKVTGRSERVIENEHTVWNGEKQDVNFYTGTVANYNGLVILDNTNAWSVAVVNISGDNTSTGDAAGRLIIQNKAVYRFHHDGDSNVTSLNIKNYGSVTVNNSLLEMEDGTISIADDAVLNVEDSANVHAAKGVKNDGTITIDGTSQLKANSYTGTGTITIDAADFSGYKKVIDLNGTESLKDKVTFIHKADNVTAIYGADGDVALTDADMSTIYVDASYTGETGKYLGDGKYLGINASGDFTPFINPASAHKNLLLADETTQIVLTAGNDVSYGWLRPNKDVEISTVGEGYAVVDNIVNCGDGSLTITEGSKLQVNAAGVVNSDGGARFSGANNNGGTFTIDGELYFVNTADGKASRAFYLWGSNTTPGELVINKTGKFTSTGANLENHGNIKVYGKMEIGAEGDASKLAGVGNYKGSLLVEGGTVNVEHNRVNFGGGDTSAPWQDAAEGCTVTITDNGTFTTKAVYFRNGKNNTLTISNGGTLEFTATEYAYDIAEEVVRRYFDNKGAIDINNGTFSIASVEGREFTNDNTVKITDGIFTADVVNNNGTFTVNGESTVKVDSFTGALNFADAVLSNDSKINFAGDNDTVNVNGNVTFQAGDLTGVENWEAAEGAKININDVTLSGEDLSVVLLSDSDDDVDASQLVINGSNIVDGKIVSNGKVYEVVKEVVDTKSVWSIKQYVAPTPEPGEDPVEPAYTPMTLFADVVQDKNADADGKYTFTINAYAENGTGTYSYKYFVNGEEITGNTFTAAYSDENLIVKVVAADAFGASTEVSSNIKVTVEDYTDPVLTLNTNGYVSGAWSQEEVTLNASATDIDKNGAKVMFSTDNGSSWAEFDGSVTLSDGEYEYWFKALDNANHESAVEKVNVKVDSIAPDAPVASADETNATNGNVTVSAAFSADSVKKEYSLDGKTWNAYTEGVVFKDNGSIQFKATDAAGNVSAISKYTVTNIDKVAPDAPVASADETNATNGNVTVSAAFSADSVKKEYSLDGKTWNAYTEGVVFKDNGSIRFKGTDAAGNVSEISEYTVSNIDKVAPEFTDARFELAGDKVVASWSVADSGSGIAKVLLSVGGKEVDVTDKTAYEFESGVFGEFKLTAFDVAGNEVSSSKLIDLGGSGSGDTEAEPEPEPAKKINITAKTTDEEINDLADSYVIMAAGKSDIKIQSGSAKEPSKVTVQGFGKAGDKDDSSNVNHVTVGNNTSLDVHDNIANLGNVKVGNNASLQVLISNQGETLAGIDEKQTIKAGKNSEIVVHGDLELGKGNDQIKIGQNSVLAADNIVLDEGNNKIDIGKNAVAQTKDITLKNGKNQIKIGNEATFQAGNINYGTGNAKLTIGKDADVKTGDITLGKGKNQIKIGNEADVTAGKITAGSANDKLTVGKDADVRFTEIDLGAGNDTFNIGADSDVHTGNILTGAGNDKLVIGKDAYLHAEGLKIDMGGDGKDTLNIKKNGQLFVDSLAGINTIKAAKGAELHITSQIDFKDINGSWKNLEIFHELDDIDDFKDGVLYGNETDLISFDKAQTASFDFDGDLADFNVEFSNDGVIWQDLAIGTEVTFTHLRVSAEGFKADEKKEYHLITKATLA